MSKSQKKNGTYLPPVQYNSRPLRSVYQFEIYAGYMGIMCPTFDTCLKILTLLVFEILGTQKSGNWNNLKIFVCLNRIPDH